MATQGRNKPRTIKPIPRGLSRKMKMEKEAIDFFDKLIKDGKIERFIDEGVELSKNVSKSLRPKARPKATSLRPQIRPDADRQRSMNRAGMLEALEFGEMGMMSDADLARLRKELGMKKGGEVRAMKNGGAVMKGRGPKFKGQS